MNIKDFIFLNVKDSFQNVDVDIYINIILYVIAIALCITVFWVSYHKNYTVKMIKQLLRKNALSENGAKTLCELRLSDSRAIKRALSRRSQLSDMVKRVGDTKMSYEEYMALSKAKKLPKDRIDFASARFYIPAEKLDRARRISEKENPSLLRNILICVIIIALFIALSLFMPDILMELNRIQKNRLQAA